MSTALGVYNGVPSGRSSVRSVSVDVQDPREPGQAALSEEISHSQYRRPAPAAATILEAPRLCACGTCGLPAPIAKRTDRRSGAIAGRPLRFVKGHAARLRSKLSFADITEDWFLDHVDTTGRHWFADATEATIEGHRVHMARIGVLLWKRQPVTPETLGKFWLARRCRHGCVRPDHQTIAQPGRNRYLVRETEKVRTNAAIEAARVRMAAFRAERTDNKEKSAAAVD
jgi:hypothetical protein